MNKCIVTFVALVIILLSTNLVLSSLIYIGLRNQITVIIITTDLDLRPFVTNITKRMKILVVESEVKNRTLYLDPNQWYCKVKIFYGGDNTLPQDLYRNDSQIEPIVFFFLEDIEDPRRADNYSDLIVRMNHIIDPTDNRLKMVIVFFCEGGYDKLVYGDDILLHHYNDNDPTSNYGIRMFDCEQNIFI